MPTLTDVVTRSLLAGALFVAVALPGAAYADSPTMDARGVVTTSRWGTTVTGYYDQYGYFNDGWKPYVLGYYDAQGNWTYYPETVALPGYFDTHGSHYDGQVPSPVFDDWRRYDDNQYKNNYYGGYGLRSEICRGFARVTGIDGQPHRVNLKDDRVLVHLATDHHGVTTFDGCTLTVHTGEHVTFVSDDGAYVLTQVDGYEKDDDKNRLRNDGGFRHDVTITGERVFNWTYTQPGHYRVENLNSFCNRQAEFDIIVKGDAVAWNDAAFACAQFWQWRSIPWVWNPVQATFAPIPIPEYNPPPHAPPPPQKVHKKIKRNQDVK